jgi:hypothetical protein
MDKLPNVLSTLMDTLLVDNHLLSWRISGESQIILSLKFGQGESVCPKGMQYFRPKSISSVQRDRQRQEEYWKNSKQEREGGYGGGGANCPDGATFCQAPHDSGNTIGGREGKDSGIETNLSPLPCHIFSSTPEHNFQLKPSQPGVHACNNTMLVDTADATCGPDHCKVESYSQSDNVTVARVKTQTDQPIRKDKQNMTMKTKLIHNHSQTELKQYFNTSTSTDLFVGNNKETKTYHPSRHVQTVKMHSAAKSTMTVSSDKNLSTEDLYDLHDNESQTEGTPNPHHLSVDIHPASSTPTMEHFEPQLSSPIAEAPSSFVDNSTDQPTETPQEISQEAAASMARIEWYKKSSERSKARIAYYKSISGVT